MAYTWPDGSKGHTIPWAQHKANMEALEAARTQNQRNGVLEASQATRNQGGLGAPYPGLSGDASNGLKGLPATGIGGPGTPPAPETPAKAPFQWVPDSEYNNAIALNKKRYDDTNTALDENERKTKFEYGIDDPTNAFSRINELKRLFLAQSTGNTTSMNSRGQLWSGANLRAMDRIKHNDDKANADLRAAYEEALAVIRRARSTNQTDYEGANLTARSQSGDRQLAVYNGS